MAGRVSAVMQTGGLLHDFTVGRRSARSPRCTGGRDRVEAVIERAGLAALANAG